MSAVWGRWQSENGDYFTGSATVTHNISGTYGLYSNLPSGSDLSGYNARSGDRIAIKIPLDYELSTYTVTAYGGDERQSAKLFFYAPDAYNQQRIVTCIIENVSSFVEGNLTVKTPEAPNYGYLSINKTAADTGEAIPGVLFRVFDSSGTKVSEGYTNSVGNYTTPEKLKLGNYTYKEVSTVKGFYLDESPHSVSLVDRRATVTVSPTNERRMGTLAVRKRGLLHRERHRDAQHQRHLWPL